MASQPSTLERSARASHSGAAPTCAAGLHRGSGPPPCAAAAARNGGLPRSGVVGRRRRKWNCEGRLRPRHSPCREAAAEALSHWIRTQSHCGLPRRRWEIAEPRRVIRPVRREQSRSFLGASASTPSLGVGSSAGHACATIKDVSLRRFLLPVLSAKSTPVSSLSAVRRSFAC